MKIKLQPYQYINFGIGSIYSERFVLDVQMCFERAFLLGPVRALRAGELWLHSALVPHVTRQILFQRVSLSTLLTRMSSCKDRINVWILLLQRCEIVKNSSLFRNVRTFYDEKMWKGICSGT